MNLPKVSNRLHFMVLYLLSLRTSGLHYWQRSGLTMRQMPRKSMEPLQIPLPFLHVIIQMHHLTQPAIIHPAHHSMMRKKQVRMNPRAPALHLLSGLVTFLNIPMRRVARHRRHVTLMMLCKKISPHLQHVTLMSLCKTIFPRLHSHLSRAGYGNNDSGAVVE
jgi:hypothetical protein